MTLVLTRASQSGVLQVSDRLVTIGGQPLDPLANKAILFLCRDAIVTIAYAGIAAIEGVPTDQWLARVLAEQWFPDPLRPSGFSFGPPRSRIDFGLATKRVATAITEYFATAAVSTRAAARLGGLSLALDGWQWTRRGRCRPSMAVVQLRDDLSGVTVDRCKRDWHIGNRATVRAFPGQNLAGIDYPTLADEIIRSDRDLAEERMVLLLRSVAAKNPLVGPHAMSIFIPPPASATIEVRYLPESPQFVAYTPWLVGPGFTATPSILRGPFHSQLGPFQVRYNAPGQLEPRGFIRGQPRPSFT